MSLHLIESRRVVTAASKKRDGVFVSVTVHALLIVSTFTLASAHPVANITRDPDSKIVYVAPRVEPRVVSAPPASAPPSAVPSSQPNIVQVPALVAPVVIPAIIPDIDVMHTADLPMDRRVVGSGSTSASGVEGGACCGTGAVGSNAVHTEAAVDKVVAILSGYRTPRYPEALRAAGVEETLVVEFVVDSAGRIETGSLTFRGSAHPSFMNAVREALANAKFHPAELKGRRVRQRVTQAFVFSLSR